jgi:hypothetical protein
MLIKHSFDVALQIMRAEWAKNGQQHGNLEALLFGTNDLREYRRWWHALSAKTHHGVKKGRPVILSALE